MYLLEEPTLQTLLPESSPVAADQPLTGDLSEGNMDDGDEDEELDDDVGEVDLAAAEEEDDASPKAGDDAEAGENVDPNTESSAVARMAKSRAPTCPLDLPFSVVRRLMKSASPNKRFTPELISAFARSAGAFALYLLSACQDAAVDTDRTTIRPVEVINGLLACGFPELAEEALVAMGISANYGKKKKTGPKRRKN